MDLSLVESLGEYFTLFETPGGSLVAIALAILAAVARPWQVLYRPRGVFLSPDRTWAPARKGIGSLSEAHQRLYRWIAGVHPARRLWHWQWLSVKDLYKDFRHILPTLRGRTLDVGCFGKPYARWLTNVDVHVGIDVTPGPAVDYVIRDGQPWPLESSSFQSVLCTQVLQVARDVPHLVNEIDRVLEAGGIAVVTTPWCYNDMTADRGRSAYKDYWRHSFHGVQDLFDDRFEIIEARRQGGVGSTTGVMFLNWIHLSMAQGAVSQAIMALLLPVWLLVCLVVNLVGWFLDRVDRTDVFYTNVLLVVRKKAL
jgi:SAM-dependent methyltransferase